MLVDEAESGNTAAPTLSTTPRNTAVPAAATYRPTYPPYKVKTGKSKQNEKLSTDSQSQAKTASQKDSPQESEKMNREEKSESGKNGGGNPVTKVEKTSISGVDKPLYVMKETHKEPVEQKQESRLDAHAQASVPFQQINEPEEQALPQGNQMLPHGQMNERVLPGIDPSIVEDTYNGMY